MFCRSRVPLRISFGGGGTDVSPYCDQFGGAVINITINRYATAVLKTRDDNRVNIESVDYNRSIEYDIGKYFAYDGQLDLIKGVINHIKREYSFPCGFDLQLHNDAPPGSGLGSSSAICVALIGAFQEWLSLPLTPYDIAELAYRIERLELKIKGGRQDQYAAAFGGLNYIEFSHGKTIVNPIRVQDEILEELNYSLVIGHIGGSHNSSEILSEQISNVLTGNTSSIDAMHKIKQLALEMKNNLVMGKLRAFGRLLDVSWENKKKMAQGISNARIDTIYRSAKDAGALGGKVSGAGGGGFMFFYTDLDKKLAVVDALEAQKVEVLNYAFDQTGLRSWQVNPDL
jgi:D-glycero-alpha-D-manno-heptose-7-phosphate kinase